MAELSRRRLLFGLLLAAGVVLLLELASHLVYRLLEGHWALGAGAEAARRAAAGEGPQPGRVEVPRGIQEDVIHPYLGYVHDLGLNERQQRRRRGMLEVTPYGFLRPPGEPAPRPEEAYRIAVVGGSVAFVFSFRGRQVLAEGLAARGFAGGRPVVVESYALAGYKQPQQLLTVAYLLSLGQRFDLVVNVDGFNELVFGVQNVAYGVHPAFPSRWYYRLAAASDPHDLRRIARLSVLHDRRARAAALAGRPGLRHSAGATLLWRLLDRWLAQRQYRLELALGRRPENAAGFAVTGPPYDRPAEELYRELVGIWRRGSLELHRLATASGMRYVHLLQPNQYAGAKPMGPEERRLAWRSDSDYRRIVERGYPLLRAAGDELRAAGVDFHDLTGLFDPVEEPLYIDDCCHFGQAGNEILARYLVEALAPQR